MQGATTSGGGTSGRWRGTWRRSAAVVGLVAVAIGLVSGDLMEIVPAFAPVVSSPIFPLLHESHDILAILLGIYSSYRWGTRWGALFLALFFVAHAPYVYVKVQDIAHLPELARLAVMGGVATVGVLLTGELARANATQRERNARLHALVEIAGSLGRPDSLEAKCSAIAEQLAVIAEADIVSFRVPDDRRQTLRVVGLFDTGALAAGNFAPIPCGEGLAGRAYLERRTTVSNDYVRASEALPDMVARGVRSLLAIPILAGTQVLGVAGIASKERDHFGPERVRLIEALVEQVGPLLEHSRLLTALGAAETLLHLVSAAARHTGDGVAITREDGTLVYVNAALENMTGYSARELTGRNPRILKSGVQDQAFYQRLWKTILSGEIFRAEMVNRKKTGELYTAEKTIAPIRDEKGRTTHFVAIDRDITERKQAEAALRERQEALEGLFEIASGLTRVGAYEDKLVHVLQTLAKTTGVERVVFLAPDETGQGVRGVAGVDVLHPDEDFTRIARSGNSPPAVAFRDESTLVVNDLASHPDANPSIVAMGIRSSALLPVRFHGKVVGVIAVGSRTPAHFTPARVNLASAMTSQIGILLGNARLADDLLRSEERFRRLTENAKDVIYRYRYEPTRGFEYVSPSATAMTGYTPEEHHADPDLVLKRVHPDDRSRLRAIATLKEPRTSELRWMRKDGTMLWTEHVNIPILDDAGRVVAVEGIARDITERKRAEEQLRKYAFIDALTDLPNRAVLLDRLGQALERVKRNMTPGVALLYIDLDRFKNVNDSMGHALGDEMLKAIGQRLHTCMRAADTVARLGGDEYAVLLDGIGDVAAALFAVERVHEAFADPFDVVGHEITISASVGIVHSTTGSEQAGDLLRDADTAMYRAKSEGGGRAVVFDTEMHTRAVTTMRTEADLQRALRQQEFRLHYQPIVSLTTGRMTGCEALIRWQHPERGLLAPDAFMRIAEETGLVVPMDRWVLHAACAQVRAWRDAGLDVPRVSINLSAREFAQKGLLEDVMAALDDNTLATEDVTLEIVESAALRDIEDTAARLDQLASSGVRVVMDDFGTGYSSLGLLHRLPLHGIKIAETFLERVPTDARDTAIAGAIIEMAHSLRLNVVAEGVETEEQLEFLRAAQCDEIQGYLVSRPAPPAEFVQLMRKGQLV